MAESYSIRSLDWNFFENPNRLMEFSCPGSKQKGGAPLTVSYIAADRRAEVSDS